VFNADAVVNPAFTGKPSYMPTFTPSYAAGADAKDKPTLSASASTSPSYNAKPVTQFKGDAVGLTGSFAAMIMGMGAAFFMS
jgi:hypothetical protein